MRKNKLYIIFAIITTSIIFTTAATCNFCGIQLTTEPSEEESSMETKEVVGENNSIETAGQSDALSEENHSQTEVEEVSEVVNEQIEEETPEEEDEPYILGELAELQTERLSIIGSRSGAISTAGNIIGIIYTGDDEYNEFYTAFLCFDVSSLAGLNIANAQLEVGNIIKFGEPSDFAQILYFDDLYYGDTLESMDGVYMVTEHLFSIPINELGESLTYSSDKILSKVQSGIDDGFSWCQFAAGLNIFTDDDNEQDGYRFSLEGLSLQIDYYE